MITIKPLTKNIGAAIFGVDLSTALSDTVLAEIYQALIDHHVVFFRDQKISPADHLRFAESFGEIDAPHPLYRHVPDFPNIVLLENGAGNPPDTDGWHTDLTFRQNPPFASILVARDIPPVGGDTLWSSMVAAYDALPDGMKNDLASRYAIHDMGDFRNSFTEKEVAVENLSTERLNDAMARFGSAIHPIVKTHPVSGKKFLYVNEGFTQQIVGMTTRESRRTLNFLLDHINRPEYQIRFQWQVGSVAMWDNRLTQHYAVSDYMPAHRSMNRITVINDRRAVPTAPSV